jgi:hypothetical protein
MQNLRGAADHVYALGMSLGSAEPERVAAAMEHLRIAMQEAKRAAIELGA